MKSAFLLILFFIITYCCFGQAYTPMPVDSATWRYRIYDEDYLTQVVDFMLYMNGTDTAAHGHTYHKIFSRSSRQVVPHGDYPPIVTIDATYPDTYYGAMRDSGKQVFLLTTSGEKLMYDFNAAVGDSIPSYLGKDKVTAIDSVLLGGFYHKRYLTTDSGYYVMEGVGSSRGLIPDLNDGGIDMAFFCFDHAPTTYTPDTSIPCTYIYPIGYLLSVPATNDSQEVAIFPVPASDVLHIVLSPDKLLQGIILNSMGNKVWSNAIKGSVDISVSTWSPGIYYLYLVRDGVSFSVNKIIIYK